MDAETENALRGSIAKWEAIVAGTDIDKGPVNCPLCQMFMQNECEGCPVAIASEATCCDNTPYEMFSAVAERVSADKDWRTFSRATSPEAKAAAQAELDFLKSLLPVTCDVREEC